MDADERDLFAQSVGAALSRGGTDDLDEALARVGWHDALREWGGPAIGAVMESQGSAGTTSGALDDVLAHALGLPIPHAVLLPRLGSLGTPARLDGDRVHVEAHATSRLRTAEHVAIVVRTDAGDRLAVVPVDRLEVADVVGLDPDAGLVSVTGELARDEVATGEPVDWNGAVALGRIAVASELVGASRAVLELGLDHARSRVQFGAPIGSFQAVRHRLADTFVAVEGAAAAVATCCDQAAPDASETLTVEHALMAKALAGRAARTATKHVQQVLAGIGFTAEHRFHTYLRRVLLLDRVLGSTSDLTAEAGRLAIERERVPMGFAL